MAEQVWEGRAPKDVRDILEERYARFGLHALDDGDIWALAMATMVMPDGNPGGEAWLAKVSGTTVFADRLTVWGRVVAIGIAGAGYMAKGGQRRRAYVEGYDPFWGHYAVADGLSLAVCGRTEEGLSARAARFACGKQAYQRIRDFVGGALAMAIAEFEIALEWACGFRRDRVLEARWEGVTGLNWDEASRDAKMGYPRTCSPLFAPGCSRTVPLKDQADAYREQPETLYPAIKISGCWDENYARRMKRECPVTIIYAPPRKLGPAADERATQSAGAAKARGAT